ncbi:acyl--CoA ligase [Alcaligenaceae bacterium]|nr:acyl--CoA ligase [Alcaligenaceae bacterium]
MKIETLEQLLERDCALVTDGIRLHAAIRPEHPALIIEGKVITYGQFNALLNQVAHSLQNQQVKAGDVLAICAANSLQYMAIFFGAIRHGAVVAPMSPAASTKALQAMLLDAAPALLFTDASAHAMLDGVIAATGLKTVSLDSPGPGWDNWLSDDTSEYIRATPNPSDPINIIYSSGTTGTPKGIIHPISMRWIHSSQRMPQLSPATVFMISTPLYSNTTLVGVYAALTRGATLVIMTKFDVKTYLELAQKHRATHTMLVPVQFQRFMNYDGFDDYDLSSFEQKFCTSSHFSKALKQAVLNRWPGELIESYGMTEGGGVCVLEAHKYPHKLHTVGKPGPGSDVTLLDDQGIPVAPGETGEIAGYSNARMTGYKNQPALTEEIMWISPEGKRYLRTGDIGRFDEDGFLLLMARKKDMIISGGFNIYPSDIESELGQHDQVLEAAVVGMQSDDWGEVPVAFVVLKAGAELQATDLMAWVNARVGKMQRIKSLHLLDSLPRSSIGKVLKKDLQQLSSKL